tara:strand:+ start:360 stop:686 length:327 start_codon:yes stop_codon:yes gene_type:complete
MSETESRKETLSPNDWGVKIQHRNRNRMKITFKLSQDEAAAFNSFRDATCPEGLEEENFVKSIFFLGLTTLEQNVTQKLAESMEVEDGEVSFNIEDDDTPTEDTSSNE